MKLRCRARQRGFTLIEMLIVIVVMGVLLALAIPSYNTTIIRSKEARLHHNLMTLNNVIQQYSLDKKQAPQQLDDLVTAGYLKFIPDDITGSNTWATEQEDPEKAWNTEQTGIASVHSGSDQSALDGSAYSSWTK
jgi:prepilin-type N-terminal cleavage/methylation domain-containing protein